MSNKQGVEHIEIVFEIYSHIPTSRKISAGEIHSILFNSGVKRSKRTIQRYLNILTDYFDVEKDNQSIPYGYSRKQYSRLSLSPKDFILMECAVANLKSVLPASYYSAIDNTFSPFFTPLNVDKPRMELRQATINYENYFDVSIFEKLCIAIHYQRGINLNLHSGTTLLYASPLGVALEHGTIYLVYQYQQRTEFLNLLDINSIHISTFKYAYPTEFSLTKTFINKHETLQI